MRSIVKVGLVLILTACVAGTPSRGVAGEIQATEVMMESQGLHAIFLGELLGPDNTSPLSFTSQVDPQGLSFQYALASGSTYQGMPLSWGTTGVFNSTTGLWSWTTTSSVGTFSLNATGGAGPFVGGDPPHFEVFDIPLPLPEPTTVISDVTYTQTAIRTVSEGTITVKDSLGTVISSGQHTDQLILQGPDKGKWMWDTGLISAALGKGDFRVTAAGFAPQPDGGLGDFTLQITAVPEPSTLVSAGVVGLFGLGYVLWRKQTT